MYREKNVNRFRFITINQCNIHDQKIANKCVFDRNLQLNMFLIILPCYTQPVESGHGSNEDHAPRDLEGHPPNDILELSCVRMESGQVQLLGTSYLGHCRSWGFRPCSEHKRKLIFKINYILYRVKHLKCLSNELIFCFKSYCL